MWWWVNKWIIYHFIFDFIWFFKRIILESDPMLITQRVQLRQDDIPLGEQTISQVRKWKFSFHWIHFFDQINIVTFVSRLSIRDWIYFSIVIDHRIILNRCTHIDSYFFFRAQNYHVLLSTVIIFRRWQV